MIARLPQGSPGAYGNRKQLSEFIQDDRLQLLDDSIGFRCSPM